MKQSNDVLNQNLLLPFHPKRKALWLCGRDSEWRVRVYRSPVRRRCYCCLRWRVRKRHFVTSPPFFSLPGLLMFENGTTRYQLVGRGTRRCMNKGWDGREPVCEGAVSHGSIGAINASSFVAIETRHVSLPAVECDEPPQVANAVMSGNQESYTYRSVVAYRCKVGSLNGSKDIWCTADGTWSAPPPTCEGGSFTTLCSSVAIRIVLVTWVSAKWLNIALIHNKSTFITVQKFKSGFNFD